MRRTVLLLAVLALPVGAQEADADAAGGAAARIELARKAMEIQIKLGDLMREKGDLDGARRAYEKALAIYEEARKSWGAAPKAPERVEKPEEVEVVEDRPVEPRPRRKLEAIPGPKREAAIRAALGWLAAHQDVDTDGKWDCDAFMKHDPGDAKSGGGGGALLDVGATGLAVLAFLGAGHTDRGAANENDFAKNVRMGLRYLMSVQDDDGVFGARVSHSYMYGHAIATAALAQAYGMTKNPRYKKPALDGVLYLLKARNPYLGWRYEPRGGENDTSVTSWAVIALHSAKHAKLLSGDFEKEVEHAFEGAIAWVDKMTDPDFGQVGYNFPGGSVARAEGRVDRFPPDKSQAMTAAGILTRMLGGQDPRRSEAIRKGVRLCLDLEPHWDEESGRIDLYYWLVGTMAMYRVGGAEWRRWNAALADAVVPHQRTESAAAGSWDPAGAWGPEGGRVVATSMMALALQVAQRYDNAVR